MTREEYFCTECEKDIEIKNVHMDYGFVKKHKFKSHELKSHILYTKTKCVKNKHLCICNNCFKNYAVLDINNHPRHRIEHFAEYAHERGYL